MNDSVSRRGFLRATAAGGLLAMPGLTAAGGAAQAGELRRPRIVVRDADAAGARPCGLGASPVLVVTCPVSTDATPRASAWSYLGEILRRAGVFFESLPPSRLASLPGCRKSVVVLAGNLPLTSAQRQALSTWVNGGGSLIGIGGTSGLDDVFGVSSLTPLGDGWMNVTAQEHPVTAGLRSSLHVFGGYVAKPNSATVLAENHSAKQSPKGGAILENRFGKGHALLLGPDLLFSVVHIQQGLNVVGDARPAPDDSAPVNEGVLKAEDGLVLDWERDRQPMQPDNVPVFLEPVSDELREIILRGIFHLAREQDITLPVLWYWPRSLKGVGHVSHDSDGNQPDKAVAMLEAMNRAKLKTTWCIQYPGGYPGDFYRTLAEQDFEIALHYDAKLGGPQTSWSKENFLLQHQWLLKEAGLRHITTNKNHYTRWEGRLDLYRWCEEAGIQCDQTRGPSKHGTIGFPLGGSQPYYPLDDTLPTPRMMNVLEVDLMTQDLVIVCPAEYGRQLLDSALRHHGVAHFLFHPAHILKPKVADTICELADYGRSQGLEWWTARQVCQWESLRRGVEARFDPGAGLRLRAARPVADATLLFLKCRPESRPIRVNSRSVQASSWTAYGFEFDAVTLDLAGEVGVRVG